MPIRIPEQLPAQNVLLGENIFTMDMDRAANQDIRPLEVGILNLMPNKIETEVQLLRLLSNTPLQINVDLIRIDNQAAKRMTIFIRTSPFQMKNNYYANSKDIDLPIKTNDSIILIKQALAALKSIYKKGYRYQKAGIVLSGLKDADIYNKNLFSTINNDEKRIKLMQAIDHTNIKYGRNALSIAQARLKKKWNIKRQYSSKIDTACFDFLPTVKIA